MTNNKKTPDIRFAGFTDAWELRKLGEVGKTFTGLSGKTKEDFGHGAGRFVTYMNVLQNSVSDPTLVDAVEIDKKQNAIQFGDVFFTTSSEVPEEVGMSSVWLEHVENTYLNSFCFGYRPVIEIDPFYLAYMLRSETVRKRIVYLAQGISRYNISKNGVMKIEVPLPQIEEQRLLGAYFKRLDALITLHQRKCEKLKNIKKSMLEKMFPREGEKFPEIRFAGFTDAWEQRKLGEIGIIKRGKRFTPADYVENNGIPCIHYGQIYTDYEFVATQTISQLCFNLRDQLNYAKTGDVILAGTSEDPDTVCKPVVWMGNTLVAYHDDSFAYSSDEDSLFLACFFQSETFRIQKASIVYGVTVKRVNADALAKVNISLPSIDEQQRIGTLFFSIDNLIALHQRKCEKLKNIKKSMLEKMFV